MPDGSSHELFANFVGDSGLFVTRDYWLYDRNSTPRTLRMPNGVTYTFDKFITFTSGHAYRYPTLVQDPYGNRISIEYATVAQAPDAILKITQFLGPPSNPGAQKREVTFTTEVVGSRARLRTMKLGTRTWTYSYAASDESGQSLLTGVQPPTGPAWAYSYPSSGNFRNELTGLTTPHGGTITWVYGSQGQGSGALANPFYYGSTAPVYSRVVTSRTTGGRQVTSGTTTYKYAQGTAKNQTIITAPASCGGASASKTEYKFLGIGDGYAAGAVWRIGALESRLVRTQGGTILESETLAWRERPTSGIDDVSSAGQQIGPNTDAGIYVPVVERRDISRSSSTYRTQNFYNSTAYSASGAAFNDYGRPYKVVETGDAGTRTTDRTFRYGFTPYIKDRLDTETITVGSEVFKRSWKYAAGTGFRMDEYAWGSTTTSGLHTHFEPTADGKGNVGSVTDGNDHTTTYEYDWGVQSRIVTPAHPGLDTVKRTINSDATIKDEKRYAWNGSSFVQGTTAFLYDDLFRETQRTPPVGNATITDFGIVPGETVETRRGPNSASLTSWVRTTVDGFGRPLTTADSASVKTKKTYDACDRLSYESYPYEGSTDRGTEIDSDALGRVTSRKNTADNTVATLDYDGIDVTLTDENGHRSKQDWAAFGAPDEAHLVAVTAGLGWPEEHTTTYAYNALGSLRTVTHPGGKTRTWQYYPSTALLWKETHPESGTVEYDYDGAGNLWHRTDARTTSGYTTTFTYDANNRLETATNSAWGPSYNATIYHDPSGNRYWVSPNAYSTSEFAFDLAGRVLSRKDTLRPNGTGSGRVFVTGFAYDGNDFPTRIDYPSGLQVKYTPDSRDRIASVGKPGAGLETTFAGSLGYHPNGTIKNYTAGNQLVHSTTLDVRQRVDLLQAGAGVLNLDYGYDDVGNVTSIGDTRSGMSQSFTCDPLDRLKTAAGFWSSSTGTYSYDDLGNRKTKSVGGTTTFVYDGTTLRLTSSTGSDARSYAYDSVGDITDITGDGSATFTYTPDRLVARATTAAGTTDYRYDADSLRAVKVGGSATAYYVHGSGGQVLSEFEEASGALKHRRDYVYAGGRLVASVRPSTPPFGSFDTPADGATGLTGAISVTGWALDDGGVTSVDIWRNALPGEPTAPNGKIYLGDAVFISGARPDVAAAYPGYPNADRAGWGYSILSNFFPNQGNGPFTLYAYARDGDGNETLLGAKNITLANANATKPFGTIDTPGQGATVSGDAYVVFGWALTPLPAAIPTDGSTIWVFVDSVPLGHPVYNNYRSDIATLFPGYANSNGAVGYFYLDTTTLANGLHTIAWSVTDNLGRTEGIGSRYFLVQN